MNLLFEWASQFEAFQVLKIFVANPNKPPRVQQILHKNKERLMALLSAIHKNRPDDEQLSKDMDNVVRLLQVPPPKITAGQACSCKDLAVAGLTSVEPRPHLILGM